MVPHRFAPVSYVYNIQDMSPLLVCNLVWHRRLRFEWFATESGFIVNKLKPLSAGMIMGKSDLYHFKWNIAKWLDFFHLLPLSCHGRRPHLIELGFTLQRTKAMSNSLLVSILCMCIHLYQVQWPIKYYNVWHSVQFIYLTWKCHDAYKFCRHII